MADLDENFSGKEDAAVLALLSSRSVEDAAKVAEVPVRTLYRWLKEPAFNAAYRQAKREAYGQAIARLHQMASAAVSTLGKVMVDPATPPATKVRAADSILSHTSKAIEIEDIEARVTALEDAEDASKKRK
jgi:hypothetical protein